MRGFIFDSLHFLDKIRPNHLLGVRKTWLETAIEWNGKSSLLWRDKKTGLREMLRAQ